MHVVPTPLAAPDQVRPPTQAEPTAGAAGQVHVTIADAAGLLLQIGAAQGDEMQFQVDARQVLDASSRCTRASPTGTG